MKTLNLWIPGEPKPKQSARFRQITTKSGKSFMHSYQKKEVIQAENNVRLSVIDQLPDDFKPHDGPISVEKLLYFFTPIKSMPKKHANLIENGFTIPKITKPDLTDNLSKGVFDALESIVFNNDSQIFSVNNAYKLYGSTPGIRIIMHLYEDMNELVNASMDYIVSEAEKVQQDLFSLADEQKYN